MKQSQLGLLSCCASLLLPQFVEGVFIRSPSSSAGIIEREIEQQYESKPVAPEKPVPLVEVEVPEEQLQIEDGETIWVSEIQFTGNTIFSDKELRKIASGYCDQELSMKDIHDLCLEIQKLYVDKGYFLARAFPPAQDVVDHVLTIEIMEGTLGEVEVVGNKYYSSHFIRRYFDRFKGTPINYNQFLKALLLANENLDLTLGAVFKKGERFGTADVILRVDDKLPLHAFIDYNNYGSHLTTRNRSGVRIDAGNLLTSGDLLSVTEVIGIPPKNLRFTDVEYTIPLNALGTKLMLAYLFSTFELVNTSHHKRGYSQIATIELKQAVMRTRRLNLDLFGTFDYKRIKNTESGVTITFDKLRIAGLGLDFDYADPLWGRNVGDVYVSYGIPDFLAGSHAVSHASGIPGAGGHFWIFNLDLKRIQQLPLNCFFLVNFSGQLTPDTLPLPEQFYIGGVDTVRGFPLAFALGDNGFYANFELRMPPPFGNSHIFGTKKTWKELLQFVAFIDTGGVFLRHAEVEDQSSHVYLTGGGVGVRLYAPWHIDVSADVGFPITHQDSGPGAIAYVRVSLNL